MEEDLLGRVTFSNNFAEAISGYDGKDCLVIGLFGSWGTGKTSVINMALDRINQINQNGIDLGQFAKQIIGYIDQHLLEDVDFLLQCSELF